MPFEKPDFVEIKMDAELSAYQGDDGSEPTPPWAAAEDKPPEQPGSASAAR